MKTLLAILTFAVSLQAQTLTGGLTPKGAVDLTLATSVKLPPVDNRRSCILDNDTQSATVLTTAQITGRCDVPAAAHLVEVRIRADTGTPSALIEKWHCSGFSAGTCTGYYTFGADTPVGSGVRHRVILQ